MAADKDKRPMTVAEMEQMGDQELPQDTYVAPADADFDPATWSQAPAGTHLMQIVEATIGPMHRNGDKWMLNPIKIKWGKEECYGLQLFVTWEIVEGEHERARIRDKLPFPAPGYRLLPKLAGRLGHAVRRWGLTVPTLPDGRQLIIPPELAKVSQINKALAGKKAYVKIVPQMVEDDQAAADADGKKPKVVAMRDDGTPWHQVALFGYDFADPKAKAEYERSLGARTKHDDGHQQPPAGGATGGGNAPTRPAFEL